jgi:hypothetical protein
MDYDQIFTTRHPLLQEKDNGLDSVWRLIYNSYLGGLSYRKGDYLFQYPKESQKSYEQRKKRSVYFNQTSPIVNMLSGMLFMTNPDRTIPTHLRYLTDRASKKKNMNSFMRLVCAYSLMYTCGVLIDSPEFDPEKVVTKADRDRFGLNPYAVLYQPFNICDFSFGTDGELDWVLLDNSYTDHVDPYSPALKVESRRLWTRTSFRDFTKKKGKVFAGVETNHPVGRVPFRFVNWRDDNEDAIAETIFEDIAYISRLLYNSMSYLDEMLASGTFKMLAYPSEDGDVPKTLKEGGMAALGIIPYQKDCATAPSFIGAELGDVDSFIKAMGLYMAEILKIIGASTDETKEFVKSGKAKKVDLEKMEALLVSGAMVMGETEQWMYKTASAWENKKDVAVEIKYSSDYSSEQLRVEVDMLTEMLIHPVASLRQNILQVLVKKLLTKSLSPEVIDGINQDIERTISDKKPSIIQTKILKLGGTESKTAEEKPLTSDGNTGNGSP